MKEKTDIAARFAAAAASYDAHSGVQRHAAARLAAFIATAGLPPRAHALELGCGTGHLTQLLSLHLPGARIVATDIAPAMVMACRARLPRHAYAVMDATRPAMRGPFDLVCANLAAQWFPDLPATLDRLASLLAPGGLLALSLLGAETFREWRTAHARFGFVAGVRRFPDMGQCRSAFPAGGSLQLSEERHIDSPPSALSFLQSLRAIGADTPTPDHVPLSAAQLRRVLREIGVMPAIRYELIYARWRRNR